MKDVFQLFVVCFFVATIQLVAQNKPNHGTWAHAGTHYCSNGVAIEVCCDTTKVNNCSAHQVTNGPKGIPITSDGKSQEQAFNAAKEFCKSLETNDPSVD